MSLLKSNKLVWLGATIFFVLLTRYTTVLYPSVKLDDLGAYLGMVIGVTTLVLGAYQTWITVETNEENRANSVQNNIDNIKTSTDKQLRHIDERIDDISNLVTAIDVRSDSLESIYNKHQSQVDERLYRLEQQVFSLRHDYHQLQIQLRHHEDQIGHKETQMQLFGIQKELANLNVVTSSQTRYNSIGLRTDYLQQELTTTKTLVEQLCKTIDSLTSEKTLPLSLILPQQH